MKNFKKINQTVKRGLLACFVLLGSLSLNAGNGNHIGSTGLDEAEKLIRERLKPETPIAPLHKSEAIEVVFTTAENGLVNFVLAKTSNPEAKQEIEKQFSRLQLNNLNANVAYSIVINFKTL